MALFCPRIDCRNRNENGLCTSAGCKPAQDNIAAIIERNSRKQIQFMNDKGRYFGSVTEFCKFYNIKRKRFLELLSNRVPLVDALNQCIAERDAERAEKQQAELAKKRQKEEDITIKRVMELGMSFNDTYNKDDIDFWK